MVRKPGSMYRERKKRPYTRREYIGGVPQSRITQFDLGDLRAEFPVAVHLVADENCQIRHVALEAARVSANRYIAKRAGGSGYHLKVRVHPHHVLRENKVAVGAGADRISEGMRAAFGTPVGTAARVDRGQRVLTIRTRADAVEHAKEALRKAGSKLPTPTRIVVESRTR